MLPLNLLLDLAAVTRRLAFEKAPTWADVRFIQKHIRPGDTVTEIGCSAGRVLSQVKAGKRIGVDSDMNAISIGRAQHPDIAFIHGDARQHTKGDVLILSHVLEHLDNPESFLSSLRFNRIYVEVPDFDCDPLNAVRLLRGRSLIFTDEDHVAEFDREELEAMFARCGMEIIDSEFRFGVLRYWITPRNGPRLWPRPC